MPDNDPPAPAVETPRAEPASRRLSVVWLVPLLALVIALGVAWRTYSERGPLIEIVFDNAAGIGAGTTQIRFRDVAVGMVEKLELSPNLNKVIATTRIDKNVAHFIDADAKFWLVRPSVTAQGVSGIETVISGVYIGASWNDKIGPRQDRFQALPSPPLTPAGQPGLRVQLRAPDGGSMTVGAPVLFKRIQVGKVEEINLTDAGDVLIDIFVDAPYHLRLTEGTRFWNASGFSIELGGGGASLNVDSLISLLQGGVSFDTVGSNTKPVESGHIFELYPSETAARQNLFEDEPGQRLVVDVDFDGSVRGLQPGASVEYHGIKVGEVRALEAAIVNRDNQQTVVLRATLALSPRRFGVGAGDEEDNASVAAAALDLLDTQVEHGLRARLAASGLLAQTLYVDLAEVPDAPPARLDRDAQPYPTLPSAPSDVSGIATSAEGVLNRITALPLEELVDSAVTLLANINSLVTDDRVRSAPENLGLLLADLRKMVDESGIKDAPAQLSAVLTGAKGLIDQATQAQLVANLNDVLATTKTAITSVGTAADGVPPLLAEIEAVSAKARELPLNELVTSATQLADNLDRFVASEDVAKLPASLQASLGELRGVLSDLRSGGAIDNVNATLASVRKMTEEVEAARLVESLQSAIEQVRLAAGNINTASADAPKLIDSLTALSDHVNELPLDDLVASANRVLATADAFLGSEGVGAVSPKLADALDRLRGILAELQSGGAVDNVNATLASVRKMTDEVETARLVESLQEVIEQVRLAAGNVNTASADAPKLIDSLTALSDHVNELPLDDLVASANRVLATADAFLGSEGVGDVPPKLADALDQLRGVLAELRSGGAVANVNATLASATRAADAVTIAAADLPALVARFTLVADRADAAIASISPGSEVNRNTLLLLQEVRDAARSVNSLALAIERRPNSVVFGR